MSLALVQRHWLENCFRRPRVARVCNFYGVPVYFRRYRTQIHDTHTHTHARTTMSRRRRFGIARFPSTLWLFAQAAFISKTRRYSTRSVCSNNYNTLFSESEIASITTHWMKKNEASYSSTWRSSHIEKRLLSGRISATQWFANFPSVPFHPLYHPTTIPVCVSLLSLLVRIIRFSVSSRQFEFTVRVYFHIVRFPRHVSLRKMFRAYVARQADESRTLKKRGKRRLPFSIRFVETKVAFRRFSFLFFGRVHEPDPRAYFLRASKRETGWTGFTEKPPGFQTVPRRSTG